MLVEHTWRVCVCVSTCRTVFPFPWLTTKTLRVATQCYSVVAVVVVVARRRMLVCCMYTVLHCHVHECWGAVREDGKGGCCAQGGPRRGCAGGCRWCPARPLSRLSLSTSRAQVVALVPLLLLAMRKGNHTIIIITRNSSGSVQAYSTTSACAGKGSKEKHERKGRRIQNVITVIVPLCSCQGSKRIQNSILVIPCFFFSHSSLFIFPHFSFLLISSSLDPPASTNYFPPPPCLYKFLP